MAVSDKSSSPEFSTLAKPLASHSNAIMAFGLVTVLATLLVPLPTIVLDCLLD